MTSSPLHGQSPGPKIAVAGVVQNKKRRTTAKRSRAAARARCSAGRAGLARLPPSGRGEGNSKDKFVTIIRLIKQILKYKQM